MRIIFLSLVVFTIPLVASESTTQDIETILEHFGLVQWAGVAGVVVLIANAITAATKTKWDNTIVNWLFKILNVLALNVFKNKNADDK